VACELWLVISSQYVLEILDASSDSIISQKNATRDFLWRN